MAERVAGALSQRGWSVWWDRHILPGSTFDQVIEQELNAARCVVVLWSQTSALSQWVKTEAAEGAKRDVLVPALIEPVELPLEFRRIQAAQLIDWNGEAGHEDFEELVSAIERVMGRPVQPPRPPRTTPTRRQPGPAPRFPSWFSALIVAVLGLAAVWFVGYYGGEFVTNTIGGDSGDVAALFFGFGTWIIGGAYVVYRAFVLLRS